LGIVKKQGVINTILVYAGTGIGAVSLLFIQPVYLTKDELGLTRLVLSFAGVLSILFSFGVSAVTVRYLPKTFNAEKKHHGFFGFLLIYTTLSVLVGLLILGLFKGLIFKFYSESAAAFNDNFNFVILLTIINAYILGFNSYCISLLRTTFPTFLNDIFTRILFIGIIFLHFFGYIDLQQFLLAFCGIYAVQCVMLLLHIFVIDKPGFIPDSPFIQSKIGYGPIIRYGVIITITALNSVSLKYLDSIFVGQLSLGAVGVYSVAAFLGLMIEIPLNALERIANPKISHAMASNNMSEISTIYYHSAKSLLLLGGLLFLFITSNVNNILTLLPKDYAEGATITLFIALGALINMATGVNYPILINSDRYIWGSIFLITLLILTIAGNIFLIPIYGMLGAAITSFLASAVYNLLKYLFIWKRFGMQPFDIKTLLIFLLICVLFFVGYYTPLPLPPFLAILVRGFLLSVAFTAGVILTKSATELYTYIPARIRKKFSFLN
jgi:O-antigen/teichoic acid export membrane protein